MPESVTSGPIQNGGGFTVKVVRDGVVLAYLENLTSSRLRTLWLDIRADERLIGAGKCLVIVTHEVNPAWGMQKEITL